DDKECPEWERYLPEEYICGTCDGRDQPLADCDECEGTGLWLRAVGRVRIKALEAELERLERYLAREIERLEGENADLRSRTSSTLPAAVKAAASALIGRIDRGVPAVGLESCVEVVARWCLDERAEP
ncbi:MAG: hypothetical protein GY702_16775, partial [Desulfobulbaceae bacterium]|nr:hypothetical protein [Desulfobulbaceae bacterium]